MASREFWLKVKGTKGRYPSQNPVYTIGIPEATAGKPALRKDEVAVKVTLDIPDSYFELPELRAKIQLPKVRGQQPEVICTMQQRAAELLKDNLGINVTFEVEK